MAGKKEGIQEKVIDTANKFLVSDSREEVQQAVLLIMNCTINLDGKKQATYYENDLILKVSDLRLAINCPFRFG